MLRSLSPCHWDIQIPACMRQVPILTAWRSLDPCLCVLGFLIPIHMALGSSVPACVCTKALCLCGIVCPCPRNIISNMCRSSPVPISTASVSLVPCSCAPVSPSLWQWCPLSVHAGLPCPCPCDNEVLSPLPARAGIPDPCTYANGIPIPCLFPTMRQGPCRAPRSMCVQGAFPMG